MSSVCDIHFCIWKLSKFIFMGSHFLWGSIFFGGKSCEIITLPFSIQETYTLRKVKNRFYFFYQICLISWSFSLFFATRWIEWLSVTAWERSWTWKVIIFLRLVSTEELFVHFRTWSMKGSNSFKIIIFVSILILYASHARRFRKLCFWHFWKLTSPVECCF